MNIREKYTITTEKFKRSTDQANSWDRTRVSIFDNKDYLGYFERNYHSMRITTLLLLSSLFIFSGCQQTSNNDNYLQPTKGEIPLINILSNDIRSPHKLHDIDIYRKLYSDFEENNNKNVEEYFYNVSHGNFIASFQGFFGPYNLEKDATSDDFNRSDIRNTILQLYNSGFDFKFFDKNNDNVITSKELLVIITTNIEQYFGRVNHVGFLLPNDIIIDMLVARVGSEINLATIVHEISHLLGALDLYGSMCVSQNLSIMSCTINKENIENMGNVVHLDPWHKIKLDWIKPRIIYVDDLDDNDEQCYQLKVPQYNGKKSDEEQRPLLIYERSTTDYFIIEYRNKNIGYNNFTSYDEMVSDYGIIVWIIAETNQGMPYNVSSLRKNADRTDPTIWPYNPINDRVSYFWEVNETINPIYVDDTKSSFFIKTKQFGAFDPTAKICLSKK